VISQAGGPATFQGAALERASYPEFVTAFNRFYARANTHEDSTAVFYFCGHGVQKGAWSGLVFDDFNSQPLNLNAHVLYYEDFELGMDRCLARQQLFILDACRNMPKAVLQSIGSGQPGQTPIAPGDPASDRARHYPVYRATTSNQVAYALAGQPSRFTSALLKALRGSACQPPPNGAGWVVQADDVVNSISDLLALEERLFGWPHQEARPSGSSLRWVLHVPQPPKVPVVVGCTPAADNLVASFSVVGAPPPLPMRGPDPADWVVELGISDYLVQADLPGQPPRTKAFLARPPYSEVRL